MWDTQLFEDVVGSARGSNLQEDVLLDQICCVSSNRLFTGLGIRLVVFLVAGQDFAGLGAEVALLWPAT